MKRHEYRHIEISSVRSGFGWIQGRDSSTLTIDQCLERVDMNMATKILQISYLRKDKKRLIAEINDLRYQVNAMKARTIDYDLYRNKVNNFARSNVFRRIMMAIRGHIPLSDIKDSTSIIRVSASALAATNTLPKRRWFSLTTNKK